MSDIRSSTFISQLYLVSDPDVPGTTYRGAYGPTPCQLIPILSNSIDRKYAFQTEEANGLHRIVGILSRELIFTVFAVDKHLQKLNQQIINTHVLYELSIKKTSVPSAHGDATVLP